jgi:membrane-associated phospholipid phosphatase
MSTNGGRRFLPESSARWRAALLIATALLSGVILLIGLLTVRGRAWWAPDQRLSRRIFEAGLRHDVLSTAAEWIGDLTIPTVLRVVTLIGAVVLWRRGLREAALWWVTTMIVAGAVAIALRYVVARPRPHWPGSGPLVEGYTFPSGHAANAAVFAGCVAVLAWRYLDRIGRVAWTVAGVAFLLLVGGSRLVLGVHRVSDVLAAWALAGALLALMLAVAAEPRIRRRLPDRVTAPQEPARAT